MNAPYQCPTCHFTVFNRRVVRCEKCGLDLPPEFRFSARDLALLAEESARIERAREELRRDREKEEQKRRDRQGSGG